MHNSRCDVLNISVRRPKRVGCNTSDVPYGLHSPTELSDDLLVGERGQVRVRPSMDGKL